MKPLFSGLLVLALLVFAPGLSPAAEKGPPPKVPASSVGVAHLIFLRSPGNQPNPGWAENTLRIFAFSESDEFVDRNMAWVRNSDWELKFKAMFERAVVWAREVRKKSPDELYNLSHQFRARPDAKAKRFDGLADTLLRLAVKRGHPKARAEEDERLRNYDWRRARERTDLIKRLKAGDPDAMYVLSGRYEYAKGLKRDLAKAYYWLLRAREAGGGENVDIAIRVLDRRIPTAELHRAMRWFVQQNEPEL